MKVPQPFPLRRSKARNKLATAPGRPDGLVLSRWRSEATPFGQPFAYTDAQDLAKEYIAPRFGKTRPNQMTDSTPKPWYRKYLRRFARRPLGYVVVEDEMPQGQAYVVPQNGEIRQSCFDHPSMAPVYDERLIEAVEQYMTEYP